MKQQPFYVGQRVVCVNACPGYVDGVVWLKKHLVYIVRGMKFFPYTGVWGVKVDGYPIEWNASRFAPYDPPAIEIPEELLKEPVEERRDVQEWKEVICENGQSFQIKPA